MAENTPERAAPEQLKIGAQMANVMFNLAQRPGEQLTSDHVAMMDKLRKQWDAAVAWNRRSAAVPAVGDEHLPPLPVYVYATDGTFIKKGTQFDFAKSGEYARLDAIAADRRARAGAGAVQQPAAQGVPVRPIPDPTADEAKLYRDLTGDAMALGYDGIPAALEALRAAQPVAHPVAKDEQKGSAS